MRTTLNINDALLQEIRQQAAQRNKTFREALEETLRIGLSAPPPAQCVRIETAPVGVKVVYRGHSMNQLYDQIEAGEIQEQLSKVAES